MTNCRLPLLAAAVALLAGCGALDVPMVSNTSDALEAENGFANNGLANNGLANNGLANNGLANNGLANNGLANNGLANNGLSNAAFSSWFGADPAFADMVMTYAVRCAHPAGSTISYTYGGTTYTWPGALGLAPSWSSGAAATEAEQQVVTACMAALVNRFGLNVPISLQGKSVTGQAIPLAYKELETYSVKEGCFFGNFFAGEGVYVGSDHTAYSDAYSTARACAFDTSLAGSATACPPIYQVGACDQNCTKEPYTSYYSTCNVNGKSYRAVTTRLKGSAIYRCGDGVCQFTESCGWGDSFDSCRADCGRCP
jgi:hypothetical protein